MRVVWSRRAKIDVWRLVSFLEPAGPEAMGRLAIMLTRSADDLSTFPRRGPPIPNDDGLEMRKLIAGDYEIRYEILEGQVWILRLFHGKEDR